MIEFECELRACVEDIGALAVYLLGAPSGLVTGQHFVVDGGMSVKMQYM